MILQRTQLRVQLSRLNSQCLRKGRNGISSNIQRAVALYNTLQWQDTHSFACNGRSVASTSWRNYATKPVSRPKAHTGRTTTAARKAPTTSKTKAAKQPAAKKTGAKAIPKGKSKPRAKPKPKSSKEAKEKRKPRKKVLTEAQKKTATIKDLKAAALKPPKGLPATAWVVFSAEYSRSHTGGASSLTKEASTEYKKLSPERLEHYNHISNQNKATNIKAYRQWIESHSPTEIFAANLTRLNLRRRGVKGYGYKLHDDRQVKGMTNPFILFNKSRHDSGDFKGLKVNEATKLSSREWKGLSASEKKPYLDAAAQDKTRYEQERKTVLNKDMTPPRTRTAPAA